MTARGGGGGKRVEKEASLASHAEDPNRRDFLTIAAGSWAAVGAAATLWPLIQQMNPDASTQALASIEVDLAQIQAGMAVTVMWRGKPVFIRNRTKEEITAAQATAVEELPDRSARVEGQPDRLPATDANRVKAGKENWLVLVGICTHLGCIPKGTAAQDKDLRGDYKGWFCVCHGSHYDLSGRIRKGPAPRNLDVPPYTFLTDTRIKIG